MKTTYQLVEEAQKANVLQKDLVEAMKHNEFPEHLRVPVKALIECYGNNKAGKLEKKNVSAGFFLITGTYYMTRARDIAKARKKALYETAEARDRADGYLVRALAALPGKIVPEEFRDRLRAICTMYQNYQAHGLESPGASDTFEGRSIGPTEFIREMEETFESMLPKKAPKQKAGNRKQAEPRATRKVA